ncbi:putative RNA-directed DNA polymerase [Helianthus annuus]|nr:putative RNA-directed DNA polymerase [Helianthus annuus]
MAGWIRKLVRENEVNMLCIQETQVAGLSEDAIRKFWPINDISLITVDAQGRSGGLVTVWDPQRFKLLENIKSEHFVMIAGYIEGVEERLNVINIYAPNDIQKKRAVWRDLLGLKQQLEGLVVMVGDFNEVRAEEDRLYSKFDANSAMHFNKFIAEAGLLEYQMNVSRFTFMTENGSSMSKIDRVLVCDVFMNKWPNAKLEALPRHLSDHNPLLLTCVTKDYGPIPFRLYNSWLMKAGIDEVVKKTIEDQINGEDCIKNMGALLKSIKVKIKEWGRKVKERDEKDVVKAKQRVEEIEHMAEKRRLKETEKEERVKGRLVIRKYEKQKIADLKQRAKVNWARLGDENSEFFHRMVNRRKSRNRINKLLIDERMVSEPKEVKEGIRKEGFYGDVRGTDEK